MIHKNYSLNWFNKNDSQTLLTKMIHKNDSQKWYTKIIKNYSQNL